MQKIWVQSLGWGRSRAEGNGNRLWYSCLGNPMDRGAWQAESMGSQKSQTQLSKKINPWPTVGPTTNFSNQLRKPNNNPYNNQSHMARSCLITDSFPNFCPHFQLRAQWHKTMVTPKLSQRTPHWREVVHFQLLQANSFQSGDIWTFVFPPL